MIDIDYINSPNEDHCEGIIWIPKTNEVAWVNVFEKPKIITYNIVNKKISSIDVPGPITSIAPTDNNNFIVTMGNGFYKVKRSGEIILKAEVTELQNNELLNDGRCDSMGRYFCVSMDIHMKNPIGKLYQLDLNGEVKILDNDFVVGNGIAFSPNENIIYVSDSRKEIIYKYDYNIVSGNISNRRSFFSTSEIVGRPDGAAIDKLGNYWSTLFEGNCIIRIDHKTGTIISKIQLPVSYPTMCCFGGSELDKVYVTTSKRLLINSDKLKEPLAGKILVLSNLGITGSQSTMYSNVE